MTPFKKYHIAVVATVVVFFCLAPKLFLHSAPNSDNTKVIVDIPYKTGDNLTDYEKEACKLDIYLPAGAKDFPTLVWFHGGRLTRGDKKITQELGMSMVKDGVAFVSVNYRLNPKVKYPSYLEDAAAAVTWTHAHIAEYGGNPGKLVVGGHSAGGYLALLISLDEHYLRADGLGLDAIAATTSVSGQTINPIALRAERGLGPSTITVDEASPVHFSRKDTVPILVLYADDDAIARAEEAAYFVAVMKGAGNKNVTGKLIPNRTHDSINDSLANEDDPARLAILEFIKTQTGPHQ